MCDIAEQVEQPCVAAGAEGAEDAFAGKRADAGNAAFVLRVGKDRAARVDAQRTKGKHARTVFLGDKLRKEIAAVARQSG